MPPSPSSRPRSRKPARPPVEIAAPAVVQAPTPSISHEELAALMAAFNDATGRLTATHERLQSEVTKLRAQLADAKVQVERSRHLALLGEMAAGIAHEVRNPLGSILLYARMLQQDLTDRPPQKSIADKIAGSVQRLESVVGDVLAFSREMRIRPQPLCAADLLEAALHTARADTPAWAEVDAKVHVDPALTIYGDHNLLVQVLVNLIRNAVDAMADGPSARPRSLRLSAAAATARTPEGRAVPMHALRIDDTGPGVDPQAAEKLFTPFFTTRASGTGLGLAIVHRIVDAHGGRVSLRSRGRADRPDGATAEVLLPLPASE